MLDHFKDYNDIVGDHPQNLLATCAGAERLHARRTSRSTRSGCWSTSTPGASGWPANGGIIPTNIGLDGKIGGAAGGKWYGGVYGWGFTVNDAARPENLAHRNHAQLGLVGFMNAYLLTGDDKYLDAWRKQIDAINAQKKIIDGKACYPRMYGDKGWYDFKPEPYKHGALPIYYMTMRASDRRPAAERRLGGLARRDRAKICRNGAAPRSGTSADQSRRATG